MCVWVCVSMCECVCVSVRMWCMSVRACVSVCVCIGFIYIAFFGTTALQQIIFKKYI